VPRVVALYAALGLLGCGTPPPAREAPKPLPVAPPLPPERDPCEPADGKPPEPLAAPYTGLLANARCRAEVPVIMGKVSRALGVDCTYCHVAGNFAATTEKKRVANWMATELVPSLKKRDGTAISCADCHAEGGAPRAKILGSPRNRSLAVEWMTTKLVERFDRATGGPLYCKACHRENLGSSGFRAHLILTELGLGKANAGIPADAPVTPRTEDGAQPTGTAEPGADGGAP
jgi:hypothetical protein